MSPHPLYLRETDVSPVERQFALLIAALLVVAGLVVTPLANTPLPQVPGFITSVCAVMVALNVLLAALLLSRGKTEGHADTIQLGAAYLFVGLIFGPMIAAFPGGLVTGMLIGGRGSSVWLWTYWHVGFGVAIIRYAWLARRRDTPPMSVKGAVLLSFGVAAVMVLSVTVWLPEMPPLLAEGNTFFSGPRLAIPALVFLLNMGALILVMRLGWRTSEQIWLTVGMVAACLDLWLTVHGGDRYALGWYCAKITSLITTLSVLLSHFHTLTKHYQQAANANFQLINITKDLHESRDLNQKIIELSAIGICVFQADGTCVVANQALATIIGGTREQLLQSNFHHLQAWKDYGLYEQALAVLRDGTTLSNEVEYTSTYGKKMWAEVRLSGFQSGGEMRLLATIFDVSTIKQAEQEFERLSQTDSLTGIANRRCFNTVLEREWRVSARSGLPLSLIMIDVDRFKQYNDLYGHLAGDDCLKRLTKALAAALHRPGDLLARFGGEEIVALLPNTDVAGAARIAEELRAAVQDLHLAHGGSPRTALSPSVLVSLRRRSSRRKRLPTGSSSWLTNNCIAPSQPDATAVAATPRDFDAPNYPVIATPTIGAP